MTRILTVVLLCTAGSVGCSTMNSVTANRGFNQPGHLVSSQSAPRPNIQRVGYEPHAGVGSIECLDRGDGCGGCLVGDDCGDVVGGCVDAVLDCNDYCGDTCGPTCGDCCCGGRGQCGSCDKLRQWWSQRCDCNRAGKCAACCKMRAVCAEARNQICDPRAAMTDANYNFQPGPPSAQTAYPYYTTRGPRDYFLDNPPSIGPY